MEREVSSVARLGVMLIAMAALISIVWVTVRMGNSVKADTYENASKLRTTVETTQLKSLNGKDDVVVPKAAAYNLVNQEKNNISVLEYTDEYGNKTVVEFGNDYWEATGAINGQYLSIEDILEDRMQGKARVFVNKTETDTYKIAIEALS